MGSFTDMAYNNLNTYSNLFKKYREPAAVLEYMRDHANFKSLSEQLKETMKAAEKCKETDETNTYVNILFSSLRAMYQSMGKTLRDSQKSTVRKWFNGKTKSLDYRDSKKYIDAIDICYALGLNLDQATEFLNKCGFSAFNVRNARDLTFLYCLKNGRSRKNAQDILDKYNAAKAAEMVQGDSESVLVYSHSGSTTHLLAEGVANWDNDDDFLNNYLIPNKTKFIGYSTVAINEYIKLKNRVYLRAIRARLEIEHDAFIIKLEEDYKKTETYERTRKGKNESQTEKTIDKKEVFISSNFKSKLERYLTTSVPVIAEAAEMMDAKCVKTDGEYDPKSNLETVCDFISEECAKHEDNPAIQFEIERFLRLFPANYVFSKIIPSLFEDDDDDETDNQEEKPDSRNRKYSDSDLADSVLKQFPHRQTFSEIVNHPDMLFGKTEYRKTLIFLYFIDYCYDLGVPIESIRDNWADVDFDFDIFLERINKFLYKCGQYPMYPPNSYDFLILRCVRQFEIAAYYPDTEDPVMFFDELLGASFIE